MGQDGRAGERPSVGTSVRRHLVWYSNSSGTPPPPRGVPHPPPSWGYLPPLLSREMPLPWPPPHTRHLCLAFVYRPALERYPLAQHWYILPVYMNRGRVLTDGRRCRHGRQSILRRSTRRTPFQNVRPFSFVYSVVGMNQCV